MQSALAKLESKWGTLGEWSHLPEGWYDIVEELLVKLSTVPSWNTNQILQLKEKLAGLRVYRKYTGVDKDDAEISRLISAAEEQASRTCQACGSPGKLCSKDSGWLFIACPKHENGVY